MNVLNRVLVVVFLLGLTALLVVGVLQPYASLATLSYTADAAQTLLAPPGLYIWWAVAAVLAIVAILLLVLELRRPRRLTVKVQQTGGVVELTTESVCRSLEYHLAQVPGVMQVRPVVASKGTSVQILLELETDPLLDVPAKSEEVIQLTHELIEGKLGLKMAPGGLRVNVRQAAYSQSGAISARPAIERPDVPEGSPLQGPTPL